MNTKTKNLVFCALFAALIAVGAYIKIPIPVVPFTLQFLFTTLAAMMLKKATAFAAVCAYIAVGLVGLPVFTSGGGIGYVFNPSFGYLIGFAVGAFFTAWILEKGRGFKRLLLGGFVGLFIVYVFGLIYYYLISYFYIGNGLGLLPLFIYGFVLAVPGDIALTFLAAIIAKRVNIVVGNNAISLCQKYKTMVLGGYMLTREDAIVLLSQPLQQLRAAAEDIRKTFCGNSFDLCCIISAKSGGCSENCKFCAQSSCSSLADNNSTLLSPQVILADALKMQQLGVLRYSIVTSGRRLNKIQLQSVCESVRLIRSQTSLQVCVSGGLLQLDDFIKLKNSGVSRIHNNLEACEQYFPNICTTHTYQDKIDSINAAANAGLTVCSGGIIGMGESDINRIDMALALRQLNITSVPLNFLQPIKGTMLQDCEQVSNEQAQRITAIYRFILPHSAIRLAGGRQLLEDKGKACFASGANATITGDMLTTTGISVQTDLQLIKEMGFNVTLQEDISNGNNNRCGQNICSGANNQQSDKKGS